MESVELTLKTIGNIGNIILKNGGKIIVEGTSDDYVTWTSIDAQSGSTISAHKMRVKLTWKKFLLASGGRIVMNLKV